jgi:hypothetical protein
MEKRAGSCMTAAIAAAGKARPGPRPWNGYLLIRPFVAELGGARAYCSLYPLEFYSEACSNRMILKLIFIPFYKLRPNYNSY